LLPNPYGVHPSYFYFNNLAHYIKGRMPTIYQLNPLSHYVSNFHLYPTGFKGPQI